MVPVAAGQGRRAKAKMELRLPGLLAPRACRSRAPGPGGQLAEQHDLRDGERLRVRDREKRTGCVQTGEPRGRSAMKLQLRGTAMADDLDVAPEDAL